MTWLLFHDTKISQQLLREDIGRWHIPDMEKVDEWSDWKVQQVAKELHEEMLQGKHKCYMIEMVKEFLPQPLREAL